MIILIQKILLSLFIILGVIGFARSFNINGIAYMLPIDGLLEEYESEIGEQYREKTIRFISIGLLSFMLAVLLGAFN